MNMEINMVARNRKSITVTVVSYARIHTHIMYMCASWLLFEAPAISALAPACMSRKL